MARKKKVIKKEEVPEVVEEPKEEVPEVVEEPKEEVPEVVEEVKTKSGPICHLCGTVMEHPGHNEYKCPKCKANLAIQG